MRVAEVDWQSCCDSQLDVLSHLGTLIPCQRPTQLLRQCDDRASDGVSDRIRAVAGESRTVLYPGLPEARHAWQMQEHRESGAAFDEGTNRGAVQPENQIAFPVTRHGAVVRLRWSLRDHDLGADERLASTRTRSRHPERTPCS